MLVRFWSLPRQSYRAQLRSRKHPKKREVLRPITRLGVERLEDRTLLDSSAPADFSALQVDAQSYDPHSFLVRFRSDSVMTAGTSLAAGTELASPISLVSGLWQVNVADGVDVHTALAAYQADPTVLYAELNYRVYVSLIPDDPLFPQLYGLHNTGQAGGIADADIDAAEAWDVHTGTGGTIVAVIDTGVDYTHPDLAGNIWTNIGEANGSPGVDDDGNGFVDDIHGYDFVNNDGDPMDDHSHGTHVSGTIGAVGNNTTGVAGVIFDVQIMGVKFLSAAGSGSLAGAVSALNYAVANGATISNNSWGGGPFTQALFDAIAAAGQQGHLFIAAAGNDGSDNDQIPSYPASYNLDNIISVAATDNRDGRAFFSNFGQTSVDLGAPGVDILSTLPGNQYGVFSGTSMATPHVTGVAALVRDLHPDWTFQQVKDTILSTVDPVQSLLGRTVTGGRLNAVAAITGMPPPDTNGPRVTAQSPPGGANPPVSSVRVTFNEAIAGSTFDLLDVVSFTGPNGTLTVNAVQIVAGSDRKFDLFFDPQTTLGDYALVIGPDIRDLAGNLMNQDGDGVNGEPIADRYTAQFSISQIIEFAAQDVPLPISDFSSTVSYIDVDQHLSIADLDVRLDLTHTYDADLYIHLYSPSGTVVILSDQRGGSGDDFQNTLFDDEAAAHIGDGSAPFAGSFRPETLLSAVDGEDAFGIWQLWVDDVAFLDQGTLNAWSLLVRPGSGGGGGGGAPPVAVDDTVMGLEDTPLTFDVLGNDSDPDGDPIHVVRADQGFSGAVIVNPDDTLTYVPNQDFNGYDFFTYTIGDGNGNEASALVTVIIDPVNDAPVAIDDFAVGRMNAPILFLYSPPGPEQNDFDADFDYLTVAQVGNAVHGTAVLNTDGSITFTPDADYVGPASFEYTVTDGSLTDVGLVRINIQHTVYFSTTTDGTLTGSNGVPLTFGDEDIVRLTIDASGHRYSLYFDGSDVGLTVGSEDIDAFCVDYAGALLISTVGNFSVPGPGGTTLTGGGEDLLLFTPTQLGSSTTGFWSIFFDGSDVGLDVNSERIDAVATLVDGTLLLSTTGAASVPGLTGQDEDLLAFTPIRIGPNTMGFWTPYFDGTAVGLNGGDSEDIDGLFADTSDPYALYPTLYFSTRGDFAVPPAITGGNEDILLFRPDELGSVTSGTFDASLVLDGSLYGLADFDLDGFHLGLAPLDTASGFSVPPDGPGGIRSGAPSGKPNPAGGDSVSLFQALLPEPATPAEQQPPSWSARPPILDGRSGASLGQFPGLEPGDSNALLPGSQVPSEWAAGWKDLLADTIVPSDVGDFVGGTGLPVW